ncbi:MAG TPA: HAD-IA family hydrolase [Pseudonocardia sp.]|jgi:sugar-phosphatase|nr:HAD-IA family hydrolase [Pseudonocardia sp.]
MELGTSSDTETVTDLRGVAAVLLDMDGTLVDSDAAVERAWRAWAHEYQLDPEAVLSIAIGVPAISTVRRLWPAWSEERVQADTLRQLDRECRDLVDVVPTAGAHRLLGTLAELRLPWAVVTSADTRLARARLGHADIHPPLLITVDDVTVGKPDPQGYLMAASQLGVDPAGCLVVEDSDAGIAAGRAAGATVASLKGRPADLRLTDLHQLAALLSETRAA